MCAASFRSFANGPWTKLVYRAVAVHHPRLALVPQRQSRISHNRSRALRPVTGAATSTRSRDCGTSNRLNQ